jgi:hypothetical protein
LTTTIELGLSTHGRHGEEPERARHAAKCRGQYRPRVQQRLLIAAAHGWNTEYAADTD